MAQETFSTVSSPFGATRSLCLAAYVESISSSLPFPASPAPGPVVRPDPEDGGGVRRARVSLAQWPPELWHTGFGGLNVNGLDVEEAATDRQSDDVSAQNARALLVPQAEILGDVLVLVDARLNLHGAVHQLLFRELKINQVP